MSDDLTSSPVGGPYKNAEAVTPSDTATFVPSVLYVGTAGDLKVKTSGGDTVFYAAISGWVPVEVIAVFDTDTDADDIVRNY
jgi:hypothetical protein